MKITKIEFLLNSDSDWLNAYYDPVAGINTHSGALELCDLLADGDSKLIAAHYGASKSDCKLKVYKGASLMKENNLVDTPTAVISLIMDNLQPRVPAIAVATGSSIYIYKNLKPGFQFNFPPIDVSGVEKDIWTKAKDVTKSIFFLLGFKKLLTLIFKQHNRKGLNRHSDHARHSRRHSKSWSNNS